MALHKADIHNFQTLLAAAQDGNLALMECADAKTGEYRAVICAVSHETGEFKLVPFGHLCLGDPYTEYDPCDANVTTTVFTHTGEQKS